MSQTKQAEPATVADIYDKLQDTQVELRFAQHLRARSSAQVLAYAMEELRTMREGNLTDDDRDVMDDWFILCAGWTLYGDRYDPNHAVVQRG